MDRQYLVVDWITHMMERDGEESRVALVSVSVSGRECTDEHSGSQCHQGQLKGYKTLLLVYLRVSDSLGQVDP